MPFQLPERESSVLHNAFKKVKLYKRKEMGRSVLHTKDPREAQSASPTPAQLRAALL